jgi:hypothetical protein
MWGHVSVNTVIPAKAGIQASLSIRTFCSHRRVGEARYSASNRAIFGAK